MSYKNFYKHIVERNGSYVIERRKDGEYYGIFDSLADALYERDRLIAVGWDLDLAMDLPETENIYKYIDLPPFNHQPTNITVDNECWVVREKGKSQRYRGRYPTIDEAMRVARIYNANVSHKNKGYRVQKRINGRTRYFGRYATYEEAEKRVKELEQNGWENEFTERRNKSDSVYDYSTQEGDSS